jgi:uncharacterized protein YacL
MSATQQPMLTMTVTPVATTEVKRFMEQEVGVTVTRVLQTVAGRMIFAQPRTNGSDGTGG